MTLYGIITNAWFLTLCFLITKVIPIIIIIVWYSLQRYFYKLHVQNLKSSNLPCSLCNFIFICTFNPSAVTQEQQSASFGSYSPLHELMLFIKLQKLTGSPLCTLCNAKTETLYCFCFFPFHVFLPNTDNFREKISKFCLKKIYEVSLGIRSMLLGLRHAESMHVIDSTLRVR